MRETKFIEQNREKWAEYEQMLHSGKRDPEKLNDLFVQITDDLSYARTFYPNRSVKLYLNHLAQRIFHQVYKGRRFPLKRLARFWAWQLPQVMWESRGAMRLSLALFALAFCIGVLSSIINPDFARMIMGNEYVDMTLSNIENGDPMAVYKQSAPLGMSLGIAANNLFVALKTALFGVLASIGTAFMMLYNGIMVGAFQYFFIERGLFWESFLTIWIHGTLEISAIIIAGGAGLTAGSGLLFPGTYSRTQAFRISMRRGLKIFIGVAPVILLAAFFEGFLTRFTETPDVLRGIFIAVSLAFVLGYFVWLPTVRARRGDFLDTGKASDLPPDMAAPIDFTAIKQPGVIISDAFTVLKRHPQLTLSAILGGALAMTLLAPVVSGVALPELMVFDRFDFGVFRGIQTFVGQNYVDPLRWFFMGWAGLAAWVALRMTDLERAPILPGAEGLGWKPLLLLLPLPLLVLVAQAENGAFAWFFGILCLPSIAHWIAALWYRPRGIGAGFLNALRGLNSWTPHFVGFLVVNLMVLFIVFMDSEIWSILIRFFSWLVPPGDGNMRYFSAFITTFVLSVGFLSAWMLLVISGVMYYFSQREVQEAHTLRRQIEQVGTTRQIRGIPKE